MKYADRVYGEVEINEPVILEIINCKSIQRLKGIDQAGYRPLWVKPETEMGELDNTRFAHSLGVYLLLRMYNAPLEEQIAGLIHDVSHLTFSHCIDYVLDSGSGKEQNHQDNIFKDFVRKTEIPDILKKYNFDLEYILDDNHFPLKETLIPDICADRIDYSIRTGIIFKDISQAEGTAFLNKLKTENNKWVFEDFETAKKFAQMFNKLNSFYYASFHIAIMYRVMADCLRYAVRKEYLSESDFYKTDKDVIEKIQMHLDDEELKILFQRMNGNVKAVNDPDNYTSTVFCKSRIVDPLFRDGKKVKRVSDADFEWGETVRKELLPKQYFLRFV